MSLVEVLVALGLFMIIVVSVLTMLGGAVDLGRDAKYRSQAISLATREVEITRDTFTSATRGPTTIDTNLVVNPSPLVGGTVGEPLVVNNVPYTVKRNAQWAEMGDTAASTCDNGGQIELAYLRVWVEVSWPDLGDRPPVTMETIITPPKGTYSQLTGHIGIKIIDSSGQPLGEVPVTAQSGSAVDTALTASDGCALFAFKPPGTYKVTVSKLGYVDRSGSPSAITSAQVQAGQLWRTTIEYDQAAALNVRFVTDSGYALPTNNTLPVVVGNSALTPSGSRSITGSGNTRQVGNLWAYPSGYQVWSGACLSNDPQYNGGDRGLPATVVPGDSTDVDIALEALSVRGPAGQQVRATQASDSSCGSGQTLILGTTDGSGNLNTSLPTGDWTITANGRTGRVTMEQNNGPESVTLS